MKWQSPPPPDIPAAYLGRPTVGYDEVRETFLGGNYGYTDHQYINPLPAGSPHHYYSTGDVWTGGKPVMEVTVEAGGDTLLVKRWRYGQTRPADYVLYARCVPSASDGAPHFTTQTYEIDTYPLRDDWVYPVCEETTSYYNGNATRKTITRMSYNQDNRQLSHIVKDYVTGCDSTVFIYPHGLSDSLLLDKGMVSVVSEQKSYSKKQGGQYTLTGGVRKDYALVCGTDTAVALDKTWKYDYDGGLRAEMTVSKHGKHGNVREYVRPDGAVSCILWSYGERLPVMHIQGASCSEIEAAGVSFSAFGSSTSPSRESLMSAKQNIEAATGAIVTLYIYDNSRHVVEVVSPSGISTRYQYDIYGRLVGMKDHELRMLESFEYNYSH